MSIYFDNAAATPVDHEVSARYMELLEEYPGNQEALGAVQLRQKIQAATRSFLSAFCGRNHADEYEVCWTASGTDAVRVGVFALGAACCPGEYLSTAAEHAAVLAALQRLPENRFAGINLQLLANGRIDLEDFARHLSSRTRFVCIHWVQSETGCIQNIAEIRQILRSKAPDALFMIDAIQGAGKLAFPFDDVMPDIVLLSGQKFGLPGGGAVVFRQTLKQHISPIRSTLHEIGRVHPALIILFAEYFTKRMKVYAEAYEHAQSFREGLLKELERKLPRGCWRKTIPDAIASPWILHLMLDAGSQLYQGAIIVRALSSRGIVIAAGSACNAETDSPSSSLMAMGIPAKRAWSGIRISFFDQNTLEECEALADALSTSIVDY